MNRRHQPHYANDGESLQADVMRFMAIIAFCLIAVLALVRNVEPPPAAAETPPAPEHLQPVAVATPPDPQPPAPQPLVLPPEPAVRATPPDVPEPILERKPRPAQPQVRPVAAPSAPPAPTPAPQPATPALPISDIAATTESAADEKGLSLRFASDRDFLRLVTKGEIQVFAYLARGAAPKVLGLDRNFEFLNADPPGQVYELLPETIPNLIADALDRATSEAGAYTWAIRMPKELEGKIRGFIDREAHGELVIDRYGEVHHVAT